MCRRCKRGLQNTSKIILEIKDYEKIQICHSNFAFGDFELKLWGIFVQIAELRWEQEISSVLLAEQN